MQAKKAVLCFVGDIMHTPESIEFLTKQDPLKCNPNYDFVFEHFASSFIRLKPDLLFGNLEMPIKPSLPPTMLTLENGYYFNGHENFLSSLKKLGFSVLQTCNNHCFDQGLEGVISTIDSLEKFDIPYVGTSKIQGEFALISTTPSGVKIGSLAFTQFLNGENPYENICPKINLIAIETEEDLAALEIMEAQIKNLKKMHSPDIIIVMVHWGDEYVDLPDELIRKMGRLIIQYGADIVIGTHPHTLQPYEIVTCDGRNGIIFYSLGNFTSGWAGTEHNNYSAILKLEVVLNSQADFDVSLIPIFENPSTFQLHFAEEVIKENEGKSSDLCEMAIECVQSMKRRIYKMEDRNE